VTDWGSDPENKLSMVANIEKNDYVKFIYVSPELCKKYSPDSNFSVPHSINCGMRRSTGRYVMYIDGDSYIPNNSLEKLYNLLKTHSQNEDDNVYYWVSRYLMPYHVQTTVNNIQEMDNLIEDWKSKGMPLVHHTQFMLNNSLSQSWSISRVDLQNFGGGAMGLLISRKILEETGFLYESLTKWGWMDVEFAQRVSARYNCMGDLLELLDCEFYHIGHHEFKVGHDVHGFNSNLRPNEFLQNPEWGLNGEDLVFDYIKNTKTYESK
jgi:glycosyltransferase involved in cell wall biosynthesis